MNKKDSGVLFSAKVKKHEKSPDFNGNISIDVNDLTAVEKGDGFLTFKLSGWKKKDSNGNTYLSISVSRFVPKPRSKSMEDVGEDIPW